MTFEKKYLKYKEKYLNLKNKNIKGGNIFSIPPCDRELDRKYHSGLWDPQNPLTKTDFDVRNNVILSLLSESMKKRDNMPKNVWDKLFNMAYNNKNMRILHYSNLVLCVHLQNPRNGQLWLHNLQDCF